MSLKGFHFVFIFISILLSAYFGLWCFGEYSTHGGAMELGMGIFSVTSFIGLVFYLLWFLKKYRAYGFFVFIPFFLFMPNVASACSVCMGDPSSPYVKSAAAGVWFLLAVISSVLVGFAATFIVWARRDRLTLT